MLSRIFQNVPKPSRTFTHVQRVRKMEIKPNGNLGALASGRSSGMEGRKFRCANTPEFSRTFPNVPKRSPAFSNLGK
jgi:hypothetical protein